MRLLKTEKRRSSRSRLEARYAMALTTLTTPERAVFETHRFDGLSFDILAERLDISVALVEARLAKAIAHIDRVVTALELEESLQKQTPPGSGVWLRLVRLIGPARSA